MKAPDDLGKIIPQGYQIGRYAQNRIAFRADVRDSDPALVGPTNINIATGKKTDRGSACWAFAHHESPAGVAAVALLRFSSMR